MQLYLMLVIISLGTDNMLVARCVSIEGPTVIRNCTIGDNVRIGAFSHLEQVGLKASVLMQIHLVAVTLACVHDLEKGLSPCYTSNPIRRVTSCASGITGQQQRCGPICPPTGRGFN